MIRVKHELYPSALVFPIQLGISIIVANQRTASNPANFKNAKVVSGTKMSQVASLLGFVSGTEHFVIAINKLPNIIDNIEAVVRLVWP
jgi:hypothetical protein